MVNKVTVTTRKGFFGYLYTWRNIVPLILNRYECQLLVANNNCYGNNMTGDTGHWKFNDEPMAIFDTGAKTSLIPIKIIEQYKIPIQKIVKCQMANNVVEECCLTIPLRTEVLGSISDIQFIGLPRDNVLLGMDWFIENKAIADPCSHAIIFKNRTMYCDTKTKDYNELNVNLTEIDIQDYNAEDIEFYDFPLEAPRDEIDFKINEKLLSSSQLNVVKKFPGRK